MAGSTELHDMMMRSIQSDISAADETDIREPDGSVGPRTDFYPYPPHPRQEAYLDLDVIEALYGGAAGGGKSDALLMGSLQYVHVPSYAALILRRTFPDLNQPGALMDRAADWFRDTEARWQPKPRTWRFPSGARIVFGYLQNEDDKYQYQSAEFQYIGFDELTQFTETQYSFMFSRLRKPSRLSSDHPLAEVPLRMRTASNPGGVGHVWVKQRFIDDDTRADRVFVPAKLADNPSVDQESYTASLMHLDPVTRAQYLDGNWEVRQDGKFFRRGWFEIVDTAPVTGMRWVRRWDLASTKPDKKNRDPDATSGVKVGRHDSGVYYIAHRAKTRDTPGQVQALVKQTAHTDLLTTAIRMEQEPGASGKALIALYRRVLSGYNFNGIRPTGSKEVRATLVANEAEAGNVKIIKGAWVSDFLDELEGFGIPGVHDDQVDATSGAFFDLARDPGQSRVLSGITGKPIDAGGREDDAGWDPWAEQDGMF